MSRTSLYGRAWRLEKAKRAEEEAKALPAKPDHAAEEDARDRAPESPDTERAQ